MYAKVINGQAVKFPYSTLDLYEDNPNIAFPSNLDDATLARFNTVRVISTGAQYDPSKQAAEQNGCVYNTELDRWETAWIVRPLTPEEIAADVLAMKQSIVAQAQERLDAFARTREYDGILSACTYATSSVPKFKAEGQYCVDARDATWNSLYTMMAEVEAGTRPMPTGYADIEADLPPLAWPA